MAVGYIFYEPLFAFVKAPLHAPLHYMSPAGSFTLVVKISLVIGVIAALPVAVYNAIMFVQPALTKRLSRTRVYFTTLASLVLSAGGAVFGFFFILPMALQFFYKFQVSGLEAIISADEYLRFVAGIIITFVLIFQLPLLISLADHIRPLPPKKLLKLEKYVIVGSIIVAIAVPFSFDPIVQLLIASPIIILYNLSILVVLAQRFMRKRIVRRQPTAVPPAPLVNTQPVVPQTLQVTPTTRPTATVHRSVDGFTARSRPVRLERSEAPKLPAASPLAPARQQQRLITDIRPAQFRLSPATQSR
jgi:sec-independent protein translocase protein TatC